MFWKRKRKSAPYLSVVIVAAGSASRMGGIDKQQVAIDDIPVVVRSILQFQQSPYVSEIVVVCREEQIPTYYDLVRDYELDKVSSVVKGGASRQDSVFGGVASCREGADFYAIHDGARPLIALQEIEQCVLAAFEFGAAATGVPVKDTVKVRDQEGFIASTPDRSSLCSIQTPQIFRADLYRRAMERALASGREYTDDCQLVENAGGRVFIAPGSYQNIKITTPEDIAVAQAILAYREGGLDTWYE